MAVPPCIYDSDGNVRQGRTNSPGDLRTLRVPETDITFIRIDHQTRLQFDDTEVVIECPFVLRTEEETYSLDPGERDDLGPLLALYPDILEKAVVDDSATLRLRFVTGVLITVAPNLYYEAWQVNGPDGYLVVCDPGNEGKLSVFE